MDKNESRSVRINLMLTPGEVNAIDDWSFANRVRTRSEAIRTLIQRGMAAGEARGTPEE